MRRGNAARNAFLKQQFGGLHERVGVKSLLHLVGMHDIVQRDQNHSLVMRHKSADDGAGLIRRQAFGRKINRFVKTETGERAFFCGCAASANSVSRKFLLRALKTA